MEKHILKSIENSNDENCLKPDQSIKKEIVTTETQSASNKDFRFSESPSLEEIRQNVEKFCNDRNWQQFHTPRNLLLGKILSFYLVHILVFFFRLFTVNNTRKVNIEYKDKICLF